MSSSSMERMGSRNLVREEKSEQDAYNGPSALILDIFAMPLRLIRPFLPSMLPLFVCLLCIPVLVFFSGAAGWIVWRSVPVGWRADTYLQYGDAVNPFANVQLPPILADQPYDISLHLVLPATESNFALGNFMVTLKLTTVHNESITAIRRSAALVPHHSSFLKQLLLGSPSIVKVDVPLLSQFISGTSTVNARLELGRSDGWKGIGNGQGRELSVLEATLKGIVRPKGIRAILARFPRLTTFVSTFIFFFISLMIVSGLIFTASGTNSLPEHPTSPKDSGVSGSEDEHDSSPPPNARRFSRRHSFKRDSDSGSNGWDDENGHTSNSKNGLQLSGLRKRRLSTTVESLDKGKRRSQIKIEVGDNISHHDATSSPYPKSPFPRPSSTDSNASPRRPNAADLDMPQRSHDDGS